MSNTVKDIYSPRQCGFLIVSIIISRFCGGYSLVDSLLLCFTGSRYYTEGLVRITYQVASTMNLEIGVLSFSAS